MDLNIKVTLDVNPNTFAGVAKLFGWDTLPTPKTEAKPEPKPKAKPKEKAEKPAKTPTAKKTKPPTMTAVRDAIKESPLAKPKIMALLKQYNAEKVSDIPKEKLADFVVDLGVA